MAELLVRVTDKVARDVYQQAQQTRRGDVIVVCPDGHRWGTEEIAAPFWRIVRVPGTVEEWSWLLSREPETDPTNPSMVRQRRAFRLNLEHAQLPSRAFFAQTTVTRPPRQDTRIPVADLPRPMRDALGPLAVEVVGPNGVRAQCVTDLPAETVTAIAARVQPLTDPRVIGPSRRVL